jgi:tetratricopeptide (TPR) repeat protein
MEVLVLGDIGSMLVARGQMEEGSIHLKMTLEIGRSVGDRHLECNALNTLSVARRGQGQTNEALACAERALEVARSAGYRRLEGAVLSNLGLILQDQGRTDEARAHYEAALAILRDAGDRRLGACPSNGVWPGSGVGSASIGFVIGVQVEVTTCSK